MVLTLTVNHSELYRIYYYDRPPLIKQIKHPFA